MIVWGIGERGDMDTIAVHSTRDTAATGLLEIMSGKGPGWSWEVIADLDDLMEFLGTGPLLETSELIGISREVLP